VLGAAAVAGFLTVGGSASAPVRVGQEPDLAKFAWADACKDCHKEVFAAWEKTKHARALNRLSDSEQKKECVGCHVTGAPRLVEQRGKVVNAGVQCESCHGAAAGHAADPAVRTGLVKEPDEAGCRACHNDKSPHFRGFVYQGMKRLVHRVVQ
jgi:hypothetical protein